MSFVEQLEQLIHLYKTGHMTYDEFVYDVCVLSTRENDN